MNGWVVRGLGLALVHAVVRTFLAAAVTQWPQQGSILRWFSLILVILAAFLGGAFDGIRDPARQPDPDDAADLTMMWLKAAFVAGILAGRCRGWGSDLRHRGDQRIAVLRGDLRRRVHGPVVFVRRPSPWLSAGPRRRESKSSDGAVAYEHDADLEVEENAAENYADSEWSYEHGNESGYNRQPTSPPPRCSAGRSDGGQGGGGAQRADK